VTADGHPECFLKFSRIFRKSKDPLQNSEYRIANKEKGNMYLIVGLGNPGPEYKDTRHNIGFMAIDEIAKKIDSSKFVFDKKHKTELAKIKIADKEAILLKPQTYMNLSGEALSSVAKYYKIDPEKTIVISDDINLEVGHIRVRYSGEAGGHKGLGSIISHSGLDFWRARIVIGSSDMVPLEDYVLQRMSADERKIIDESIDKVSQYLIESISQEKFENQTIN
jgi:PTH1 family peptidyl-tRNA hydrolase